MNILEENHDFDVALSNIQKKQADEEYHWILENVIVPEFPHLIEALQICGNLIEYNSPQLPDLASKTELGPAIKLPVSSTKSETLKGIMVRDGVYVTHLSLYLKDHYFNKDINKLKLKKPLIVKQLVAAKKSIEESIDSLKEISELSLQDCKKMEHLGLVNVLLSVSDLIQRAKCNLQLPTDPELIFPLNVTPAKNFEPELSSNIAIDIYVSQAELCLDLKSLHKIQERPWCEIDDNGFSYVDKLRDEMRLPSTNSTVSPTIRSGQTPPSQPLNMADIEQRINDLKSQENISTERGTQSKIITNLLTHLSLKPKYSPVDYITKCISYNNSVVMINKKIEVSSPDPILVSVFTKLDSIEYLIGSFLENLQSMTGSFS